MRVLVVVSVLVAMLGTASAQVLRHDDVEALRTDLKSMTVRTYELKGGKLVEVDRQLRTYDKAGQVTVVEHRRAGKVIVRWDYKWSNGRIARRAYREPTGANNLVIDFTYKLDAQDRVIEMTLRNPKAANGEHFVTTTTWQADGRRSEVTERHYPNEGPYGDGSAMYGASGRIERRCSATPSCEMFEYDAHGVVDRIRDQMGPDHAYREFPTTYDAKGRLATRKMGSVETTFHYDAKGNVTEEKRSDGGKTLYSYVRR